MDVVVWLRSLGLEQYEAAFRDNAITEKLLPTLTAEDLKDLGVSVVGHRRALLNAIVDLRSRTDTQPLPLESVAACVPIAPTDTPAKRRFRRHIGIDYFFAQTPTASLKGLRVYVAEGDASPQEILAPVSRRTYWSRRGVAERLIELLTEETPTLIGIDHGFSFPLRYFETHSRRTYWSRRGVAERLIELLTEETPTLIGIDHGFSFPLRYFETHSLKLDWAAFLDDFQRHWPTNEDHAYVDFVRDGVLGDGAKRAGNARWRHLTEERAGSAKSVFHFDVHEIYTCRDSVAEIYSPAPRRPRVLLAI